MSLAISLQELLQQDAEWEHQDYGIQDLNQNVEEWFTLQAEEMEMDLTLPLIDTNPVIVPLPLMAVNYDENVNWLLFSEEPRIPAIAAGN